MNRRSFLVFSASSILAGQQVVAQDGYGIPEDIGPPENLSWWYIEFMFRDDLEGALIHWKELAERIRELQKSFFTWGLQDGLALELIRSIESMTWRIAQDMKYIQSLDSLGKAVSAMGWADATLTNIIESPNTSALTKERARGVREYVRRVKATLEQRWKLLREKEGEGTIVGDVTGQIGKPPIFIAPPEK